MKLYHPELDRVIDVSERAARVHLRKGWVVGSGPPILSEPERDPPDPIPYERRRKQELVEALEDRGLDSSGNKAELVERLIESDGLPESEDQGGSATWPV